MEIYMSRNEGAASRNGVTATRNQVAAPGKILPKHLILSKVNVFVFHGKMSKS